MDLETFEARAWAMWSSIPAHFRDGVSALVIEPGSFQKEEFEGGWVYGYCEPDHAVMALPDAPVRSIITLFYGSFVHIAAESEGFDWEEELWETVTHELRHHLEWMGGVDHLGDEDDIQDDLDRWFDGREVPADFHRGGVTIGRGVYLAAGALFLEVELGAKAWASLSQTGVQREWGGIRASVPANELDEASARSFWYASADVVEVEGDDAVRLPFVEVVLALRRRRGWFARLFGG